MILYLENLGIIKQAKIDLDKKFTLFCGRNSTGKTYASYILQAFLTPMDIFSLNCFKSITEQIIETGSFKMEKSFITEYLNAQCKYVKEQTGIIFGISDATSEKLFGKFGLSVEYSDEDFEDSLAIEIKSSLKNSSFILNITKTSGSNIIKIDGNNIDVHSLLAPRGITAESLFCDILHHMAFRSSSKVRMLTVERNSIYTFKTELSLSRNELIDRIQQSDKTEINIFDLVNTQSRRYPQAVRSSLRIANDLENIQKYTSPFAPVADLMEKDLLHGEVNVTKNGDVEFHAQHMPKTKRLPFHLSSSIVKTMASLVIYLRHLAQPGDTLIIDEPEMNFHPDVQVLLARIFAILTTKGLHVVMSTHSDYVVRELNNLIMAKALQQKGRTELLAEMGYTEEMQLDYKDVAVLFFEHSKNKVVVKPLPIDELGFSIAMIDDTIMKQNETAERLYAELTYSH